jgi:hypothetical protein
MGAGEQVRLTSAAVLSLEWRGVRVWWFDLQSGGELCGSSQGLPHWIESGDASTRSAWLCWFFAGLHSRWRGAAPCSPCRQEGTLDEDLRLPRPVAAGRTTAQPLTLPCPAVLCCAVCCVMLCHAVLCRSALCVEVYLKMDRPDKAEQQAKVGRRGRVVCLLSTVR